ncbi:MAG: hypothetical protein LKI58_11405 [Actinomyces sp.]|jgi:phosphoglycerate dehydrogenase-like enzyme|nr:NAD(P)-dependent oxidoreductase [Actinomyces sp.]MCI1642516.1 hypothetical protein [Actinomyces sp.]MCI1663051.1 hypothetical protein [Actinomyces sp.]MCI1691689.1 hypothetical protein [Actinomyces sp.]MCI1788643.1 hypothetical protein [Actinomyces sp.]MCI1829745.1 hypothetical protein [Actinomyces sp.]
MARAADRPVVAVTSSFDRAAVPEDLADRLHLRWAPPVGDARPLWTVLDEQTLREARAVVVELASVDEDTLGRAPSLEAVIVCRGTPSNVDLEACRRRGIPVLTTPGRNAAATADLTLALIISAVRRVDEAERWIRSGAWSPDDQYYPYDEFRGPQLADLTLGIVGLGAVGREVARRALAFGLRTLAYGPHLTASNAPAGVEVAPLDEVLRLSDIVTLHAPGGTATAGLIGSDELARMRSGAVLVNAARASLVDEGAVLESLRSGHLAAAAFDVFWTEPPAADHPLLHLPRVVVTPHIGGASDSVIGNHSRAAVAHLVRWLAERETPVG